MTHPPLIVSLCTGRYHPATQELITELRYHHGWEFAPFWGAIGVDRVRSQAASMALERPNEWQFWVDDDTFAPSASIVQLMADAQRLDLDFLAALVPCRRTDPVVNASPLPGEEGEWVLGEGGGIREVRTGGIAMACVHRRVFERLNPTLPRVRYGIRYEQRSVIGRPYFHPIIEGGWDDDVGDHCGEDMSFCRRARATGSRLYVDTSVVAMHAMQDYVLSLADIAAYQRRTAARAQELEVVCD